MIFEEANLLTSSLTDLISTDYFHFIISGGGETNTTPAKNTLFASSLSKGIIT